MKICHHASRAPGVQLSHRTLLTGFSPLLHVESSASWLCAWLKKYSKRKKVFRCIWHCMCFLMRIALVWFFSSRWCEKKSSGKNYVENKPWLTVKILHTARMEMRKSIFYPLFSIVAAKCTRKRPPVYKSTNFAMHSQYKAHDSIQNTPESLAKFTKIAPFYMVVSRWTQGECYFPFPPFLSFPPAFALSSAAAGAFAAFA